MLISYIIFTDRGIFMDEIFAELENRRKKASALIIPGVILFILGILAAIIFGSVSPLIIIAVAIILLIIGAVQYKKFASVYKEKVVKGVLGEVFDNLVFEPKSGISYETVSATGMMNMGDRFSSNDLITGTYHGVGFMQSDVHIEEESTDSDGHTSTYTLFRGRWMIFDFNKTFHCDLQIISRRFTAARRKGGIFSKKENKMPKIELENEEFNKAFTVYAHDTTEAFYILTPHMQEALLNLYRSMKSPIMLMFCGGNLHIAAHTGKDAFEPNLTRKLVPEKERAFILADTKIITEFVDEMKLDNDIYKN